MRNNEQPRQRVREAEADYQRARATARRQRRLAYQRAAKTLSLAEIAAEVGVSRGRVKQIIDGD